MLTQFIAFGVMPSGGSGGPVDPVEPGTGTVIATPQRTAVLAILQSTAVVAPDVPLGASPWGQALDPADRLPYAVDFSALLDVGEGIATIEELAMPATAVLLGVGIDTAEGYGPIIDEGGKKLQIWFAVDEASWTNVAYLAGGVRLAVKCRIATDATPQKRIERTVTLTVRQQ